LLLSKTISVFAKLKQTTQWLITPESVLSEIRKLKNGLMKETLKNIEEHLMVQALRSIQTI
jgi:hypothetical protein